MRDKIKMSPHPPLLLQSRGEIRFLFWNSPHICMKDLCRIPGFAILDSILSYRARIVAYACVCACVYIYTQQSEISLRVYRWTARVITHMCLIVKQVKYSSRLDSSGMYTVRELTPFLADSDWILITAVFQLTFSLRDSSNACLYFFPAYSLICSQWA